MAAALVSLAGAGIAHAQTYTVPDGQSTPITPPDGSIITLQGNASIPQAITLPTGATAGAPDLTINAASGGSTITLGAGFFSNATAIPVTLNLGGAITFTGANANVIINGNNGGGVIASNGAITINGALLANNNIVTGTQGVRGSGGVLYAGSGNIVQHGGDVDLENNQLKSAMYGGAIAAVSGSVGLENGGGDTGAVTSSGNVATIYGGGIYAAAGAVTNAAVSLGNGAGAIAISSNWAGYNRDASGTAQYALPGNGGGIYSTGITALNGATATLSNNRAIGGFNSGGNFVIGSGGGAIYSQGSLNIAAVTTIDIEGNWAGFLANGNASQVANGGAISVGAFGGTTTTIGAGYNSTTTLTAPSITLSHNWATGSGGGIYSTGAVTINGNLTADDNHSLNGNTVIPSAPFYPNGSGAAISAQAGNATINGSAEANGNKADGLGGFISAANFNSTGTLYTVTLGRANSTDTVDLENNLSGPNVANTNASTRGGAIFATGAVTLNGSSITLTGNQAVNGQNTQDIGGAIYSSGGGMTLGNADGSTQSIDIENNKAGFDNSGGVANTLSAGGALVAAGTITLNAQQITLSGNQATGAGGGIYAISTLSLTGALTANNNIALNGPGGAIYAANSNVADASTVSMNGNQANWVTSGAGGGGIAAVNGSVSLATGNGRTGKFTGNTAIGNGGVIYATGNVTLGNLTGTLTITGNSSTGTAAQGGNGGAIYATGNVILFGTDISNNTAAGNGGVVNAAGNFTLTSTTADTIGSNKAGALGGAIYVGGNATLNAAAGSITFSGNTQNTAATAQANAIYLNNTPALATTTLTLNAQNYPITFYDPIQNTPGNGLLTVAAAATGTNGAVVFDGSQRANDSIIYGVTTVQSGTFAVQQGAIYGALLADVAGATPTPTNPSSFAVAKGATLAGGIAGTVRADAFALAGTLDIAGAAKPGTSAGGFSTFTVISGGDDLTGGTVVFNTCLNDASAQRTDLLTLNLNGGATSGAATIRVNAVAGCAGALTAGDGIELVEANNGTTTDAFASQTGTVVAKAGPYAYTLYQGGLNGANPQNWYLRSALDCALDPGASACGGGNTGNVVPTPIDARWMLALIGLLLAAADVIRHRPMRGR